MEDKICDLLRKKLTARFAARVCDRYGEIPDVHWLQRNCAITELGVTIQDFKEFLEEQQDPDMTWDNWGDVWDFRHGFPFCRIAMPRDQQAHVLAFLDYRNYRPFRTSAKRRPSFCTPDDVRIFCDILSEHKKTLGEQA
jgi:hypothetical protein